MKTVLQHIDDGHCPGATSTSSRIAIYDKGEHKQFLSIFDNLLPEEWCDKAYNYAVERQRPWGTYVTSLDAQDSSIAAIDLWNNGEYQRAISLVAVRALLYERGSGLLGVGLDAVHGTAVWCLCASEDDSVNYHIDYAELYRYETNIIYPPIFAGTCHLSPLNCSHSVCGKNRGRMTGGDFQVNVGGLEHYKRFGYKGRLATHDAIEADRSSPDWTTVRYRRNRGILHDGDYPHQSSPVERIISEDDSTIKRVILGFNCFPAELAECCGRAPEHSDSFNRTIRLYQTMAGTGTPITSAPLPLAGGGMYDVPVATGLVNSSGARGVSIADLKANPRLARMLVLAAKNIRKVRAVEKWEEEQRLASLDLLAHNDAAV